MSDNYNVFDQLRPGQKVTILSLANLGSICFTNDNLFS